MHLILNLLIALLAFFLVRYVASLVMPEGRDTDRLVTVIAVIAAILVFFANFASRIIV